jgi:hypothetical protein
MKKLLTIILILALAVPAAAFADLPDISNLSYDELIQLKDSINLAIWNSQEWQEVEIPAGVWTIGKDIPAGHWKVSVPEKEYTQVYYCKKLDETGMRESLDESHYTVILFGKKSAFADHGPECMDFPMAEGWYFINNDAVIFTPYTGKPDLGFKQGSD